jgi:hypothetical protein
VVGLGGGSGVVGDARTERPGLPSASFEDSCCRRRSEEEERIYLFSTPTESACGSKLG